MYETQTVNVYFRQMELCAYMYPENTSETTAWVAHVLDGVEQKHKVFVALYHSVGFTHPTHSFVSRTLLWSLHMTHMLIPVVIWE